MTDSGVYQVVRDRAREAGLGRIAPHQLRHTFAHAWLAAGATGVSQAVGSRWFRQAGGMPPITLAPLSGRYLSFAEREEVAILRAQQHGVRAESSA